MANKETLKNALTQLKLSSPSKMPGFTMALTARTSCPTGSKLRAIKGSVCENCYACKGFYAMGPAKAVRAINDNAVAQGNGWAKELVQFLLATKQPEFRFHDSGDITSMAHLEAIAGVANSVPTCKFWVPTKEYRIVREYLKANGSFPINMCVRISAPMIGKTISESAACGLPTSSVNCESAFHCPVKNGKEGCDTYNCRACWNRDTKNVNYHKH